MLGLGLFLPSLSEGLVGPFLGFVLVVFGVGLGLGFVGGRGGIVFVVLGEGLVGTGFGAVCGVLGVDLLGIGCGVGLVVLVGMGCGLVDAAVLVGVFGAGLLACSELPHPQSTATSTIRNPFIPTFYTITHHRQR